MSFIYIIGGGPGAGKSSVAQTISKRHGFDYLKSDALVGEHQQEAAERKYPVNNYINSLTDKDQQLELIKLSGKQEQARQEELFFILLKELRIRKFDRLVLEGNCLFPDLVTKYFESDFRGVWLLPTLSFQKKIYPQRDWVPGLLKKSDNPDITLKNWLQRDHEYNNTVRRQVRRHGFPLLSIDGRRSLDYTIAWAEQQLGLEKPHGRTKNKARRKHASVKK